MAKCLDYACQVRMAVLARKQDAISVLLSNNKTGKTVSVEEDQNQAKEAGLDGKESNSKAEKTVSMEELAKVWHQCVPSFSTLWCVHY